MLNARQQKENKRSLAKDLRKKCAVLLRRDNSTDVPGKPTKTSRTSIGSIEYNRRKQPPDNRNPSDSDQALSPPAIECDKQAQAGAPTSDIGWSYKSSSVLENSSPSQTEGKVIFSFDSESEDSDVVGNDLGVGGKPKNSPSTNLKRSCSVGYHKTMSSYTNRGNCPRRRAEKRCTVYYRPIRLSSSDSSLPKKAFTNAIVPHSGVTKKPVTAKLSNTKANTLDVPYNSGFASPEPVTPTATTPTTKAKFNITKNVKKKFMFLRRRHTDTSLVDQLEQLDEANKELNISSSQLANWRTSFSALLEDPVGLRMFQSFLRSEFSEENINFWIACQDFQNMKQENMRQAAYKIYYEYVAVAAPMEINLDSATRVDAKIALENPTPTMFGRAQRRIQGLMEKDSYPRFLQSTLLLSVVNK